MSKLVKNTSVKYGKVVTKLFVKMYVYVMNKNSPILISNTVKICNQIQLIKVEGTI